MYNLSKGQYVHGLFVTSFGFKFCGTSPFCVHNYNLDARIFFVHQSKILIKSTIHFNTHNHHVGNLKRAKVRRLSINQSLGRGRC